MPSPRHRPGDGVVIGNEITELSPRRSPHRGHMRKVVVTRTHRGLMLTLQGLTPPKDFHLSGRDITIKGLQVQCLLLQGNGIDLAHLVHHHTEPGGKTIRPGRGIDHESLKVEVQVPMFKNGLTVVGRVPEAEGTITHGDDLDLVVIPEDILFQAAK